MDKRSNLAIKLDALQRLIMINCLSGFLPIYVVTEYPKSGGTWVGQMVSEILRVPFPRNKRPDFQSCLLHTHLLYMRTIKNVLVVFRDGRDVMVSQYFHMLFENEKSSPILVKKTRGDLSFKDYHDVEHNLPTFIDYIFDKESSSVSPYHFTWTQFVNSWRGKDVATVKYEDMVAEPTYSLRTILRQMGRDGPDESYLDSVAKKYSFENQAMRKPGEENRMSFLRKGRPGDWMEKFNRKSALLFDEYAGSELIELGYAVNRSWVNSVE
jgi:hypothetical protein|tara:strand:+ start:12431 stop:13234 length:804 start_codon:yes stop_codon:yes gene_type:complete